MPWTSCEDVSTVGRGLRRVSSACAAPMLSAGRSGSRRSRCASARARGAGPRRGRRPARAPPGRSSVAASAVAIGSPSRRRRRCGGRRHGGAERVLAGRRLGRPSRSSPGREREAARRAERVHREVAAPVAQRGVHLVAIVVELAGRRLAAEHVGAQVAEGAVVGHQPEAARTGRSACRSGGRRARRSPPRAGVRQRRSHSRRLRSGGCSSTRPGATMKRSASREALERLRRVGHEAPELDAVERVGVERGERHAVAGALEAARAAREGMGREREPARGADRAQDALGAEPVVDLVVHAEGQAVVAPRRRDLLAHEQQHAVVPALVALALGLERVVVGEHHHVHPGAAPGPHDLRAPCPCRPSGASAGGSRRPGRAPAQRYPGRGPSIGLKPWLIPTATEPAAS